MNRLIQYINDTRAEMRHVSWPTRRHAVVFTVLIILLSITVAIFLGFFDFIFSDVIVDRFFLR
ncbi:MAG: preprotein translocase subunit SecE [Patescibacteria group bacterium]